MQTTVDAPFQPDQIDAINAYQQSRRFHPFTCQTGDRGVLAATTQGLVCPYCDYTQTWVYAWMADGTWQAMETTGAALKDKGDAGNQG